MNELMKQENPDEIGPLRQEAITPMGILQMAIAQGADIDKMTALLELQERWEANIARKAFVQAMADFKKEAFVITKDKINGQYSSRYTSIGNLINTSTPFLSKHGLSASWSIDQSSGIKVSCTITHALGHSGEPKTLQVPLDTSGAKNPLQQLKSSITYARIVTFEMACGLASAEGNLDDDGNDTGTKSMDMHEFDRYMALIEGAGSEESLKQIYLAAAKDAQDKGDKAAVKQFVDAKNARWRELHATR